MKAGELATKRQKRRQTAHSGQPNGPHPDATPPVARPPTSTLPMPVPMRDRDRLTGEPLRRETPKLVIRDHYRTRTEPLPLKLHVLQDETIDSHARRLGQFAGGMRWSPEFGEYLGNETTALETALASNYHWQRWWESAYLTRSVAARIGLAAFHLLLAFRACGRDYAAMEAHYHVSPIALYRLEERARGIARHAVTAGGHNGQN